MYIKLGHKWTIDAHLVRTTKQYYYLWLDANGFWDDDHADGYDFIVWNLLNREGYSPTNTRQTRLMLQAFDVLDTNAIFIRKMKQIEGFRDRFNDALNSLEFGEKQYMIALYKYNGYPVTD